MNDDYIDPIEDDQNAIQAEHDKQKFFEMAEKYADFKVKNPDLYAWLYSMADADEKAATEKLIENISDESNTEQRFIIRACRYYRQWLEDGDNAVAVMRTQTEPSN